MPKYVFFGQAARTPATKYPGSNGRNPRRAVSGAFWAMRRCEQQRGDYASDDAKQSHRRGQERRGSLEKFMCYCQTGIGDMKTAIDRVGTKILQVESALKEAAAEKAQLEADTKEAQVTRAECKEAIATAISLCEKEAWTV